MEDLPGRIEELQEVPIFAALTDEQLAYVAEAGDVARVARGEVYAWEGEPVALQRHPGGGVQDHQTG
jgi:hypothetical protein